MLSTGDVTALGELVAGDDAAEVGKLEAGDETGVCDVCTGGTVKLEEVKGAEVTGELDTGVGDEELGELSSVVELEAGDTGVVDSGGTSVVVEIGATGDVVDVEAGAPGVVVDAPLTASWE